MDYLTVQQVLFIHARLIEVTGGGHGVRDLGALEAAVARPQATFDGQDLYPDVFSKAAALMQSLIGNHPFVDGNKRTAIAAAGIFMRRNGWRLTADTSELEEFTWRIARSQGELGQIAVWFEEQVRREGHD